MRGCFSTSQTDGTEESFRMSLRSLLATKERPIPSPSFAKKLIEGKLGIGTRRTLQARTHLLDSACHNLAKAKQRTLVSSSPSYYVKSDILLFPLPLPPGYSPSNNSRPSPSKPSNNPSSSTKPGKIPSRTRVLTTTSSSNSNKGNGVESIESTKPSSVISKKDDDFNVEFSFSSNSPCSSGHSSSNSSSPCPFCTCSESLAPTSPTSSSSVFSAARSSLSQSSSFGSSSSTVFTDLRCNSLHGAVEDEDSSSFFSPSPPQKARRAQLVSPLREFSPLEIARACEGAASASDKLADGAMGPLFKVFLPEEKCFVAITSVTTKLSRRKWRTQVQELAQLTHSNLSKVIGFSYERAKYGSIGSEDRSDNMGFIVYKDIGDESLKDFLQDVEKGIDWVIRLKLAIGVADGLSFLLENMPSHVGYGDLTMDNVRVDSSVNAKLFDFVLPSSSMGCSKDKRIHNLVKSLGNVLLQLFGFVGHPHNAMAEGFGAASLHHHIKTYPQKDAKVVLDLAASCLLPEVSLCPSIRYVARVLHSIEPTQHKAKYPINRSKSFAYRKNRSFSFG